MTIPQQLAAPQKASMLPGAAVIARIRRLISVAVGAGAVYSIFTSGSRGGCAGGISGDGGFIDANGDPTSIAPTCVTMALRPSPIILIALVGIIVWALGRVLRRAEGEASALRMIDHAALAITALAVASLVIAHVWFTLIPLDGIDGSGTYIWPFPFATVELQTSPMVGS
jgi:hypothetical protein